jgi:hypothetical protein
MIHVEQQSLVKAGWTRHQEKYREASLVGADGAVRSTTDYSDLNQPPRPREFAPFFLVAQPPLLQKEGTLGHKCDFMCKTY